MQAPPGTAAAAGRAAGEEGRQAGGSEDLVVAEVVDAVRPGAQGRGAVAVSAG